MENQERRCFIVLNIFYYQIVKSVSSASFSSYAASCSSETLFPRVLYMNTLKTFGLLFLYIHAISQYAISQPQSLFLTVTQSLYQHFPSHHPLLSLWIPTEKPKKPTKSFSQLRTNLYRPGMSLSYSEKSLKTSP